MSVYRTTHAAPPVPQSGPPEFRNWRSEILSRHDELLPTTRSVEGRTLYRTLELDAERVKKGKAHRTIEAILSSGSDVQRRGYVERLEVSEAAVNLERVKAMDGLPLLWTHKPDAHLGICENVRIVNGKMQARLKLTDSADALEKWRAIEDGTLRGVSLGYVIDQEEWIDRGEDGPMLIAKRWTPHEASIVTMPADTTALIGRSLDLGIIAERPSELDHLRSQRDALRTLDLLAWEAEGDDAEQRMAGKLDALRSQLMSAQSPEDFEALQRAFDDARKELEAAQTSSEISTVHRGDSQPVGYTRATPFSKRKPIMKHEFSLCRALAAQIDPASAARAGYEIEMDQELRGITGRTPQGMMVPESALLSRAFNKATEGADVVATNLASGMFIQALRPRMVTGRLGATILDGLRGDVKIPRKTGDVTAYWIGGDGADAITESDPTTDNITLAPKTVGARTIISRKMLLQAEPAAEMMVRDSIMSSVRQAIDKQAMIGSGSGNTPTGILNIAGIGSNTYANGGAPAFGDIVDLEGELIVDDADFGSLGYVVAPAIATGLKQTDIGTDTGKMVWTSTGEGEGRLNGYRALTSSNLSAGFVLFGNWSDLLIGYWSGIDFQVDTVTRSQYGDVIVTALIDLDVKVRHPESFAELKEAAP